MSAEHVCLHLFLDWLHQRHGSRFAIERTEQLGPGALSAAASDGPSRLAVEVHALLEPDDSPPWLTALGELEREISANVPGAYALWLPPGAPLPADAEERAAFVERVQETARQLAPGQRSHVALPVTIYLRKQNDDGALVSVVGGLSAHWARLSEGVKGSYDLDSSRVHRLPESEGHVERLIETIWERARRIERAGQREEIETIDAWTIQRLHEGEGVTIVGRPPTAYQDAGLTVRRSFRRVLTAAAPRLRDRRAELRAVVVLGFYGHMEEEGVTTAMRGYDPTLYLGLDFVGVAADGAIKAAMEGASGARPRPGA